jgi:site-specific DNA-methyltransferase (adenine-specific)
MFEMWDIKKFVDYKKNPRKNDHAVDSLCVAISEFGFRVPVVVNHDGVVIDGHLRLKAARKLNLTEVPALVVKDLTENQIQAFRLSVNKMAELAEWDIDLLKTELSELIESDFDISLTGFTEEEIQELFPIEPPEELSDPDDMPEVDNKIITKPGDVWVLDTHRLLCGDSTSIDDIEKLTENKLVDMWLTDPPYNVSYEGATKEKLTIQNDSMSDNDFRVFLTDCYTAADACMKPGAVFYIWHAGKESYNFIGALLDLDWKLSQCLIWQKHAFSLGRHDYHFKHEPCLYGWKEGNAHKWYNDRKQTTLLDFNKPTKNLEHPTMKPVELFEYQMLNNTKNGDTVLDSFGGSGTTMIAAEKNGRKSRICEIDPKYCDVIIRRWQNYTGKNAVLEGNKKSFNEMYNE